MLISNRIEIPTTDVKWPIVFSYNILGMKIYGAINDKNKQFIRRSPLGLQKLTKCKSSIIKDLQK